MTQHPPAQETPTALSAAHESALRPGAPFNLTWINAVDPRTFTPYTWTKGGTSTIRLRAADDSIRINVEGTVEHRSGKGIIELFDEIYVIGANGTEAGRHEVTKFKYTFDTAGSLTDFDPAFGLSDHMQGAVSDISKLVYMPGSTISGSVHDGGIESNFVSTGTQWVRRGAETPAPALPAIEVGQLALHPSATT